MTILMSETLLSDFQNQSTSLFAMSSVRVDGR